MPDKRYKRACGKNCVKCSMNKLKHGNKLKKKGWVLLLPPSGNLMPGRIIGVNSAP